MTGQETLHLLILLAESTAEAVASLALGKKEEKHEKEFRDVKNWDGYYSEYAKLHIRVLARSHNLAIRESQLANVSS